MYNKQKISYPTSKSVGQHEMCLEFPTTRYSFRKDPSPLYKCT